MLHQTPNLRPRPRKKENFISIGTTDNKKGYMESLLFSNPVRRISEVNEDADESPKRVKEQDSAEITQPKILIHVLDEEKKAATESSFNQKEIEKINQVRNIKNMMMNACLPEIKIKTTISDRANIPSPAKTAPNKLNFMKSAMSFET
jgi:hypothetical protein